MLTIIDNLPYNVAGFLAEGELTGKDYEKVLIPAIAEKLTHLEKLSVLFELSAGFAGFSLGFVTDKSKLGLKYWGRWDKVAIVSDHHFINAYTNFLRHFLPVEIKVFDVDDFELAKTWITTSPGS